LNFRNFVPPIFIDLALSATRKRVGFTGSYLSFEEAEFACKLDGGGYEDLELVKQYKADFIASLQSQKFKEIDSRNARILSAYLIATSGSPNQKKKILDFGGGSGNHFFGAFSHVVNQIESYVICESPAVATALQEIKSEVEYVSNINEYEEKYFDVILASCVLPYISEGENMLKTFFKLSDWVILDRMPVLKTLSKNKYAVQHALSKSGARLTYPATFFAEKKMFELFEELNAEMVLKWEVPEDKPYFNGGRNPYVGYLLKVDR
jgi:putative methyltransferase (TIGR04325 family)